MNLLKKYITIQFKTLKDNIEFSDKFNSPLCFCTSAFGETLTCILKNTKGSGTNGGGSFDTCTGDEVKTLMKLQSKKCTNCGYKNTFFSSSCHSCGHESFEYATDTRAGIDSKSHFKYYNELDEYIIVEISPEVLNHNCRRFKLSVSKIKKDNKFFNSLLNVQKQSGTFNKNLLTTSVEYLMSCPCKMFTCVVDVEKDVKVENMLFYGENEYEMVPKELFKRQYKEYQNKIKVKSYDPFKNELNIIAVKGNHGKKRGKTKRNNILKS